MLKLSKFSVGIGDRFAQQAEAQLRAFVLAAEKGADVVPVWNKSNREHLIVGSEPPSVQAAARAAVIRAPARAAVKKLGWKKTWPIDADHIRLETVGRFLPCSDFFTIDVADSIGKAASPDAVKAFADRHPELTKPVAVPGIDGGINANRAEVERIANKFLFAVQEAAAI